MALQSGGAGTACQFSSGVAPTGDLTTEYLRGGRGSSLLYLHGLGRWSAWDSDHIGLALKREVFAPTFPGWKTKRLPEGVGAVADYARLMVDFMDSQQIEQADIVANSVGGWVAMHMALLAPSRIARLVLVNAMGIDEPEAPAADIAQMDESELYQAAFAAKDGMMVATGDFGGVPLDLRGGEMFRHMVHGQRKLTMLSGGKCGERGLLGKLKTVDIPTLLIWGEDDRIAPLSHGELLDARLPNSRLVAIHDAGHCPQKEKPNSFVRLVTNFLLGKEEQIEGVRLVS